MAAGTETFYPFASHYQSAPSKPTDLPPPNIFKAARLEKKTLETDREFAARYKEPCCLFRAVIAIAKFIFALIKGVGLLFYHLFHFITCSNLKSKISIPAKAPILSTLKATAQTSTEAPDLFTFVTECLNCYILSSPKGEATIKAIFAQKSSAQENLATIIALTLLTAKDNITEAMLPKEITKNCEMIGKKRAEFAALSKAEKQQVYNLNPLVPAHLNPFSHPTKKCVTEMVNLFKAEGAIGPQLVTTLENLITSPINEFVNDIIIDYKHTLDPKVRENRMQQLLEDAFNYLPPIFLIQLIATKNRLLELRPLPADLATHSEKIQKLRNELKAFSKEEIATIWNYDFSANDSKKEVAKSLHALITKICGHSAAQSPITLLINPSIQAILKNPENNIN